MRLISFQTKNSESLSLLPWLQGFLRNDSWLGLVLPQGTFAPNLKLVSFQISGWCPSEVIARIKYCQKCVFGAQKDYDIIDDVKILVEVGKIFSCNCHE